MAGLLDIFNSEQGRMGLGLLGGGFGQQLRQGVESMDAYKKQQMIAEIQKLQMQKAQAEMADHAEQRKAQAAQLIEQQRLQSLFRNAGTVPANMQGTEAANAMLPAELRIGAQAQLQQPGKIDYNALRQQGMPAAMLEQLAKIQDLGMPEVARTIKGMQNGREVEQQYDKFGRLVGHGIEQFKAPIMMDRGAQIEVVSPYTAPGAIFPKTMTFGDKNAAANLALSQQRLKMEQGNQNKPQWIESLGGFADPRTQRVMPARDAQGNPIEGSGKALTEAQGNATAFAARMFDADKTLQQLESKVSPTAVAQAGYRAEYPAWLPGGQILGAAATAGNQSFNPAVTDQAQQYRQAQENWVTANLRKESGAAISKDEMDKDIRKWFPQPGESEPVKIQKANARQVAQRAMLVQAGPGKNHVGKIVSGENTGGAHGSLGGTASDPLGLFK